MMARRRERTGYERREHARPDEQATPPVVEAAFPNRSTPNPAAPPPRPVPSPGYSRFVALMKLALPLVALVLVMLVVLWPQLQERAADMFTVGFADLDGRMAESQRLVNARYYGTDAEDQPFTITADLATETAPGSRVVRLDNPKADIALNEGAWIMLGAAEGLYHQETTVLELAGGVDVFHDAGYELHTSSVTVDMTAGTARGMEPVAGQGPFGELAAEGFRLSRDGRTVVFTGKARVLLHPTAVQQSRVPVEGQRQ